MLNLGQRKQREMRRRSAKAHWAACRAFYLPAALVCAVLFASGCEVRTDKPEPAADSPEQDAAAEPPDGIPTAGRELPELKKLSPEYDVWVDGKRKRVVMRGEICLNRGALEMFACLKGTKEHESIVAVDAPAKLAHAGLLAVGAEVGGPVEFDPQYKPASGTEVEVLVIWADERGRWHQVRAEEWIRNIRTEKELAHPFVFAGSGFWRDERTGEEYYMAEAGDFICVSNFPSAMLDLTIESSQSTEQLLFQAWEERIPPLETKVFVVLVPKLENPETRQTQ